MMQQLTCFLAGERCDVRDTHLTLEARLQLLDFVIVLLDVLTFSCIH